MIGRASLHSVNSEGYNRVYVDPKKEEASPHHGRDLVHINAGGKRYTTLLDTLVQSKSSYFSNFIRVDPTTGKIILLRDRFLKDETGAIFVNRDGELFSYVLQYMRDGKNTVLPKNLSLQTQLKREAEFFGMESFKQDLTLSIRALTKEQYDVIDELQTIRNIVKEVSDNTYTLQR